MVGAAGAQRLPGAGRGGLAVLRAWRGLLAGLAGTVAGLSCGEVIDAGHRSQTVVTDFAPRSGPTSGGGVVRVEGLRLDRVSAVFFGDIEAQILKRPAGAITLRVPPGAPGPVRLRFRVPDGMLSAAPVFRYHPEHIAFATDVELPGRGTAFAAGALGGDAHPDLANLSLEPDGDRTRATLWIGVATVDAAGPRYRWTDRGHHWVPRRIQPGQPQALRARDLDGDGRAELIWYDPDRPTETAVLIGIDASGRAEWTPLSFPEAMTHADLLIEDLDRDGVLDLAFVGDRLQVLWGGGGHWGEEASSLPLFERPTGPPRARYDREVFAVVSAAPEEDRSVPALYVMHEGLAGPFAITLAGGRALDAVPGAWSVPTDQRLLGLVDVAGTGQVSAFTGDDSGTWTVHLDVGVSDGAPVQTVRAPSRCRMGPEDGTVAATPAMFFDVTGDGLKDAIALGRDGPSCVFVGAWDGSFRRDPLLLPDDDMVGTDLVVADFDGDGVADILRVDQGVRDFDTVVGRMHFGPGMTRRPRVPTSPVGGARPATGLPRIVDRGGESSIYLIEDDARIVRVRPVAGATLRPEVLATLWPAAEGGVRTVDRVVDLDQDGHEELVVAGGRLRSDRFAEVWRSGDDGWHRLVLPDGWRYLGVTRWDDEVPVVVGQPAEARDFVEALRLDGAGRWVPIERRPLPPPASGATGCPSCQCLHVGHYNGDAELDLLYGCRSDHILIHPGAGRGFSGTAERIAVAYGFAEKPVLTDVDGDGFLDLMAHGGVGRLHIRWGVRGALFAEETEFFLGDGFEYLGSLELDGDGRREHLFWRQSALHYFRVLPGADGAARRIEGPFLVQSLATPHPEQQAPIGFPVDWTSNEGSLWHQDWTGDGLGDLLFLLESRAGRADVGAHLVLWPNVSR